MTETTDAELAAAIALARRALAAAERNRADENPNRSELRAISEYQERKRSGNRALLESLHGFETDEGDEND